MHSPAVRPTATASHFAGALTGAEPIAERRVERVLADLGSELSGCEIEVSAQTSPEGSSTSTSGSVVGNRDRVSVDVVAACPDRIWRAAGVAVAIYSEAWSSSVDAARRDSSYRALELALDLASFELVTEIRAHGVSPPPIQD